MNWDNVFGAVVAMTIGGLILLAIESLYDSSAIYAEEDRCEMTCYDVGKDYKFVSIDQGFFKWFEGHCYCGNPQEADMVKVW